MKTRIYRDYFKNLNAETNIDMPEIGERRFLRVNTSKRSDGLLTTSVSVSERNADGSGYTHALFRDFFKTVLKEKVRCTEKAVAKQHEQVLQHIASFKDEATRHYGVAA